MDIGGTVGVSGGMIGVSGWKFERFLKGNEGILLICSEFRPIST